MTKPILTLVTDRPAPICTCVDVEMWLRELTSNDAPVWTCATDGLIEVFTRCRDAERRLLAGEVTGEEPTYENVHACLIVDSDHLDNNANALQCAGGAKDVAECLRQAAKAMRVAAGWLDEAIVRSNAG